MKMATDDTLDGIVLSNGDYLTNRSANGSGGGLPVAVTPRAIIGTNQPTSVFDLSVISGLRDKDKYKGNLVRDIKEAYKSYIAGSPFGRGGKYATDAARKYGYTFTEAARVYLAGILPEITQATPTPTPTPTPDAPTPTPTPTPEPIERVIRVLADELKELFGGAVYNPPLQSQATGYTPVTTSSPIAGAVSGGSSIMTFLILGVIGVIAYFVYKRFAG